MVAAKLSYSASLSTQLALSVLNEGGELFWRHYPCVEVCVATIKHERARALGICRRKDDRHRGAFGGAQQNRAPAASSVHDGADIVHPCLDFR